MNQNTRQRIVGTVVLLLAALILLPVLFDGEGSYQQNLQSRIPEAPPVPEVPRALPQRPIVATGMLAAAPADTDAASSDTDAGNSDIADDPTSPPISSPEQTTPAAVADADRQPDAPAEQSRPEAAPAPATTQRSGAPGLDNRGLPEGWSVRLATFSNPGNARNLLQRLQDNGYAAYVREISTSQGLMTAVFVGPRVEREAVQALQAELQQQFQLTGMVVRYQIEEL